MLLELIADKGNPIFSRNDTQVNRVAKLIEWHALVLEDVCEQVLFAAQQTLRNVLLQLPCTAKPFLDRERIRKLANLLKLVDANNDAFLLLFCDPFG